MESDGCCLAIPAVVDFRFQIKMTGFFTVTNNPRSVWHFPISSVREEVVSHLKISFGRFNETTSSPHKSGGSYWNNFSQEMYRAAVILEWKGKPREKIWHGRCLHCFRFFSRQKFCLIFSLMYQLSSVQEAWQCRMFWGSWFRKYLSSEISISYKKFRT